MACLLATQSHAQQQLQDPFVFYFGDSTALTGVLAGSTFDSNGDFWLIGRDDTGGIRKVVSNGSTWQNERKVFALELDLYYRSNDVPGGVTDPEANAENLAGTPANFLLNPAPLTIEIPVGPTNSGATQIVTYQPGELAYFTDAQALLSVPGEPDQFDATKRLTRYDLRETQSATTVQPDFETATLGGNSIGMAGRVDWNDVFTQVISRQDIRDAAGGVVGSDGFGRSFAWSSDGQSIYATDVGSNTGGIYKIDATQTGVVTRIRTDLSPQEGAVQINSEPAVVSTSAFDYDPTNPAVGDQIIVTGSGDGGNQGGLNVYLDTGAPGEMADPYALFTETQFREFSDYYGASSPFFVSVEADDAGNLYFFEARSNGLYRYDTQGRFSSIATERQHAAFQVSRGGSQNQNFLDLQARPSTLPGFEVTELIYTDDGLRSVAGVLVYKPGDFDRDNDVDSDDLNLFAGALTTRNAESDDMNAVFDLSGPGMIEFRDININDDTLPPDFQPRNIRRGPAVVDWKDIKILQEFADIPNGDTNFDGLLDFIDLDTMAANYFTLGGAADKRWLEGDFASADPRYLFDAVDANLVNEVDIDVIVDAWLNELGQTAPDDSELTSRYSGQFLTDLMAAFSSGPGLIGDYNNDGFVNPADYALWASTFGSTGAGLAADGNGDGIVDASDYTIWRDNIVADETPGDFNEDGIVDAADYTLWRDSLGQSGPLLAADGDNDGDVDTVDYQIWRNNFGNTAATSQAVPEPASQLMLVMAYLGGIGVSRRKELKQ